MLVGSYVSLFICQNVCLLVCMFVCSFVIVYVFFKSRLVTLRRRFVYQSVFKVFWNFSKIDDYGFMGAFTYFYFSITCLWMYSYHVSMNVCVYIWMYVLIYVFISCLHFGIYAMRTPYLRGLSLSVCVCHRFTADIIWQLFTLVFSFWINPKITKLSLIWFHRLKHFFEEI